MQRALLGYLNARSEVRSQHKLPTFDELIHSIWFTALDCNESDLQETLDRLVVEGRVWRYGPYYSTRQIDVL